MGLGAIPPPPAPSRSGCRNRGGNGGGEALAQVLSTPPPHWPPSSGPCPPEQQGWGPACGKERKGRWGVSWSSRGKGLALTVSSCNPPHLLPQPWRREEETRRVLKALFCEWDERGSWEVWGEGRFPLDTQLCPCHTSRLDHTRLHAHANSQPYLLYKSPLSRHSPQLEGGHSYPRPHTPPLLAKASTPYTPTASGAHPTSSRGDEFPAMPWLFSEHTRQVPRVPTPSQAQGQADGSGLEPPTLSHHAPIGK